MWRDLQGSFTATVETDVGGRTGFLRLSSRTRPELSVEAQLRHNLAALQGVPQHSRLRASSKAGKQQREAEVLVQLEECTVSASGVVMSQSGLRGSLSYQNNCSVIQVE